MREPDAVAWAEQVCGEPLVEAADVSWPHAQSAAWRLAFASGRAVLECVGALP